MLRVPGNANPSPVTTGQQFGELQVPWQETRRCYNKHTLVPIYATAYHAECSLCETDVALEEVVMVCSPCQFTECRGCWRGERLVAVSEAAMRGESLRSCDIDAI